MEPHAPESIWKHSFVADDGGIHVALTFCVSILLRAGLDLTKGRVRDNFKAGVMEPAMSKIKSIRFATGQFLAAGVTLRFLLVFVCESCHFMIAASSQKGVRSERALPLVRSFRSPNALTY